MLQPIIFSDEITLWWTKDEFSNAADTYKIYVDDRFIGQTNKTHYSLLGLEADRAYSVCIEALGAYSLKKNYEFQTKKKKNRLDITQPPYYALGDGVALNTKSIQKALDDCTENDYVYFPQGVYLSGALDVHSDTEIYLEEGAVLQGTASEADYLPKIKSRFEGIERECYRSLINIGALDWQNYGFHTNNVYLRGKGCIYGGGRPLADSMREKERERLKDYLIQNEEYVKTCETIDTIPGRVRGRLINISNGENVIMSGLTLGYSPSWNIHFVYSKNVYTYNCIICSNTEYNEDGSVKRQTVGNGDGWDPDSSEDCAIFDTVFKTGDDCVAIKSGKNPEGNVINRPSKNIYIFDCVADSGHSISIGSEMSGGVENVYIWDCDLRNCYFGLQVKSTKKRGGYVRNVRIFDSVVSTIYVASPPYNDDGEGSKTPPILENFAFENVIVRGYTKFNGKAFAGKKMYVALHGFDDKDYYLKNVCFNNIAFLADRGESVLETNNVDGLEWKNINYIKE